MKLLITLEGRQQVEEYQKIRKSKIESFSKTFRKFEEQSDDLISKNNWSGSEQSKLYFS